MYEKQFTNNNIEQDLLNAYDQAVLHLDSMSSVLEAKDITTPKEVFEIISTLKKRIAAGMNGLKSFHLKHLPVFNACLRLAYFPICWKTAVISPIPKASKPQQQVSSYRPVALLSSLNKVYEAILLRRIRMEMDVRNVELPEQFGFRKGHNCVDQALRMTTYIQAAYNRYQHTVMTALDLSQAFDKIVHSALLLKLESVSFSFHLRRIIRSYLADRSYLITSLLLDWCNEVPQGSKIGPILFTLFFLDFPDSPRLIHTGIYADDIALITSATTAEAAANRIQPQLTKVTRYCNTWGLTVNPVKTQSVIFILKRPEKPNRLRVASVSIPWSSSLTYLGIILDSRLSFIKHINHLLSKLRNQIHLLYGIIKTDSAQYKTRSLLHTAYFRPILTYGSPLYIAASHATLRPLFCAENRRLR